MHFLVVLKWILVISYYIVLSNSLIAYDCMHERSNITTVSLLSIGSCLHVNSSSLITVSKSIQLIQTKEWAHVHAFHCKADIIRTIFHCGMHSHTSVIADGISSYLHEFNHKTCKEIHEGMKFRIYGQDTINIKGNTTMSHQFNLIGDVDNNGNCKGGKFMHNGNNYYNVIVQITMTLLIKDYYTTRELMDDNILFNDGTTCKTKASHCVHPTYGFTFWDFEDKHVCNKFSRDVIYEGMANITSVSGSLERGAMISVFAGTSIFNIIVKDQEYVCSQLSYTTNEARVFVILGNQLEFFFKKTEMNGKNFDLNMYLNYKIAYVFDHIQNKLNDVYMKLTLQDCELERKTLINKLQVARHHPHSYGNILTDEPGYMSIIAGEVIHIAKCQMVEVSLRRDNRCYNNIPVIYNNKSMFLEPFSKTITNTTNEVVCSMILPVMYYLDSEWYSLTPQAIKVKEPVTLGPQLIPERINYTNINNLINGGIYDADAMKKFKEALNFPLVKIDANNYVSSKVTGTNLYSDNRYSTHEFIDQFSLKEQMLDTMYSFFGWTKTFGAYAGALLGMGLIYKMITKCLSTFLNGATLYQAFGCGFHLLASIMTSLTHLVFQKKQDTHNRKNDDENDDIESQQETRVNKTLIKEPEPFHHSNIMLTTFNEENEVFPMNYPKLPRN